MSNREDEFTADLLQGTLDLLVLKALTAQPLHGLGVSNRIKQITKGTFDVKPGSLFPALHRMEEAGWLSAAWGESENNRRAKFYRLTAAGRRQLQTETRQWETIALAIYSALQASCPMAFLSRLASLRRNLFARPRVERDLDDELRAYLDQLTQENCAAGMDEAEALR